MVKPLDNEVTMFQTPGVSPIARRVCFGKIFIADPLSIITLVISYSLIMLEMNNDLLQSADWDIFLVTERYRGEVYYLF